MPDYPINICYLDPIGPNGGCIVRAYYKPWWWPVYVVFPEKLKPLLVKIAAA